MATLTLNIPEDLKRDLEELKDFNWSAVARKAIQENVAKLRFIKSVAAKSKLNEKEALELSIELGRKVRAGIHKQHVKRYGA